MVIRAFIICMFFMACSKKENIKPNYIYFKLENDSIFVNLNNKNISPLIIKIENEKNNKSNFIDINTLGEKTLLKFSQSNIDTNFIIKNYNFSVFYGPSNLKRYDTFYNYGLPFSKNKRYRILQGNNGSFSHNKISSKYAIDFSMNIGEEVCAIRDGIVINVKNHFDENGTSKKYLKKANLILVHHKDKTFVQYGHFKKNGVIVKIGDTIKKGQLIGFSGNTGMSTSPHLHFTIYKPTKNGLVSIPFILDSIPSQKYKTGKYATNN